MSRSGRSLRIFLGSHSVSPIPWLESRAKQQRSLHPIRGMAKLTGMTTLLVLVALVIFGGEVIRGFAIAMIWGVLIGTFSSFGVAVPLLIYFGLKQAREREAAAPAGEAQPAAKP